MIERKGQAERPAFFYATAALLAWTFVTGGGSMDYGWGDAAAQLGALALLPVSVARLARYRDPRATLWLLGLLAVPVIVAMAMQHVPMPWTGGQGPRGALTADVQAAGLRLGDKPSLDLLSAERGAWFLLPALSILFAVAALGSLARERLLKLLVVLTVVNVVYAWLQLGAPQDSLLNPFPQWPPAFGGVFANPNHHGSLLAVAVVLALSWWRAGKVGGEFGGGRAAFAIAPLVLAALFAAAAPLTGSRGAMVLVLGGVAVLLMVLPVRGRSGVAVRVALLVGIAAVAVVAWKWMRVDQIEEVRTRLALATLRQAADAWPSGIGIGAFVDWFGQHAGAEFALNSYFNHAHNEYPQWLLEFGAGSLLLCIAAACVAYLAWAAVRERDPRRAVWTRGCTISIAVLAVNSTFDYPLRTAALAAALALLVGCLLPLAPREKSSGPARSPNAG